MCYLAANHLQNCLVRDKLATRQIEKITIAARQKTAAQLQDRFVSSVP
jgi:hypothetical protein